MGVTGIDHVQVAMPKGSEDLARAFYTGKLGLAEVPKPAHLAVGGGVWFQCGNAQLHLGGEMAFVPAKKAHPALIVDDFAGFIGALARAGLQIRTDPMVAGRQRASLEDCFGNKLELIERA
jgi:catechol 2,3-dioxygenase-like lactoylglutathione lyase family enzyme